MKIFLALLLLYFFTLVHFAEAATYYVAKAGQGGNNANSCAAAQTISTPKLTIQGAKACWGSGDTIEIRAGTYNEIVAYNDWPSGGGWGTTTKVKNYNGETVIIHITDSGNQTFGVYQAGAQYISFDGLIINQTFTNGNGAGFIELKNSIVRNSQESGITGTSNNRYTNNTVHNNGTHVIGGIPQDHGFYIGGSNNTITNNTVYSNCGVGIHFNNASAIMSNNVIAFNRIYGNATCGGSAQLLISNGGFNGANNEIYGNVVYSPVNPSYGIWLSGTASSSKVYNNTVYNHGTVSGILDNSSGGTFRNNISIGNSPNLDLTGGGSVTASHNLCGPLACTIGTNNRTEAASATFTNVATNDFTLKASPPSLAINNGTTTGNPTGNTVDIAGTPRTGTYDIGAYETGAAAPVVNITGPVGAATYSTASATINVSGTSSGTTGTVTWTCDRCTPASGIASGGATWTMATLTLKAGINVLTVSDGAGSDTLTITYAPSFPGNALVAAYGFEEVGGSTATDTTGNGNTGTLIATPARQAGRYGNGLLFNGTTQYVTVLDSNGLDFTQSFTLSAWVRTTTVNSTFATVLSKNGGQPYLLHASVEGYCGTGRIAGFVVVNGTSGPAYSACDSGTLLQVGVWTHLAVTYDGANLRLYRQGALVTTTPATGYMEPTTSSLDIAHSEFGEFFAGMIDEVRLYNHAIPLTGGANTTFAAPCNATAAIATPSVIGDANCPVVALAPPIAFKVSGASSLKMGATGGNVKIGQIPP